MIFQTMAGKGVQWHTDLPYEPFPVEDPRFLTMNHYELMKMYREK
jgi:hypothetical protein